MNNFGRFLEKIRIRTHQRFEAFYTNYPGFKCRVIDKSSFLFMYEEIFVKKIYDFKCESEAPYLIDAGANIGLATIFWKQQWPEAEVVALEPDPKIMSVLKENLRAAKADQNVTAVEACLAESEGEKHFYPDGADGGSTAVVSEETNTISVKTLPLSKFLNQEVDFLKLDIEGDEYEVLREADEKLKLVKQIFVEYHSHVNKRQQLDEILKILQSAGFRYYIEHIGIRSPRPYLEINTDHGMDLQLNIYGYRA